jgi:hypothetical protein
MAFRTKDKVAKNPEGILRWMKDLNPGIIQSTGGGYIGGWS